MDEQLEGVQDSHGAQYILITPQVCLGLSSNVTTACS